MKRLAFVVLCLLAPLGVPVSFASAIPGDPDRSFGQDGRTSVSVDRGGEPVLRSLVRLPDKKLLAAGGSGPAGSSILARFLANGRPDPAFGMGGVVKAPGSLWAKLVVQPGEGVVAFGRVGREPAVARFTFEGSLDPSFGDGGVRILPVRGLFDDPALAFETDGPGIDSAGRIVATALPGSCSVSGEGDSVDSPFYRDGTCGDMAIVRLTADGDFDSTFGNGDGIRIAAAGSSRARTELAPDDSILIAGTAYEDSGDVDMPSESWIWVRKLDPDGDHDPDFGKNSWFVNESSSQYPPPALLDSDPAGKVTVAFGFTLVRLRPDGSPDRSFGEKGIARAGGMIDSTSRVDPYLGAGAVTDDHIYLAGSGNFYGRDTGRAAVAIRLNRDGELDPTFAADGAAARWIGPALPYRLLERRKGLSGGAMLVDELGRVTVGSTGGSKGLLRFALNRFKGGEGRRLTCKGKPATVQGTPGDDRIYAGEVTVTGGGNDVIRAAAGLICSGPGDDSISNGEFSASGYGARIHAGPGDDFVKLGGGASFVSGGTGNDRILGPIDRAEGGPGNDLIAELLSKQRRPSQNTFLGGSGNDRLYGLKANDRLFGGPGRDLLAGGQGDDRLKGEAGNDHLLGGPGADLLLGGPGRDLIEPGTSGPPYAWYRAKGRAAKGTLGVLPRKFARGSLKVRTHCWREGRGKYLSWTDVGLRFEKLSKSGRFSSSHRYDTPWGDYGDETVKGRVTSEKITVSVDITDGWTGTLYTDERCSTGNLKVVLRRINDRGDIVRQ